MASIIRIKRSSTNGNPSTLGAGELAYSALTGTVSNGGDRLYIGIGSETAGDAANHFVIGGKYFTDMLDQTPGTLTATSAIVVDSDSKIDNLKVDNLDLNGNTISSTDTNGNIVLDPAGTGYVTITGTNGIVIPVGTDGQRGPTVQGTIRYNTDSSSFEGYSGATWGSLGGVKSVDGLTYITAESSPGASDDTLNFVTNGTQALSVDTDSIDIATKITTINVNATTASTTSTSGALVVDGGVGIAGNLNVGGDIGITGAIALDSDVAINGGDLYSTATTFNLLNKDAAASLTNDGPTTVNAFLNAGTISIGDASGTTTVNHNFEVTGTTTLKNTTTVGQSGTRVGTTVYAAALSVTATDNSEIGVTAGASGTKTLTVTASNSVGDANLDINVDDTATLDANVISLDALDSSNFSMSSNSSSTKTLTIDASNVGTGAANIAVGSSSTDNLTLISATKTTLTGTSEVEINSDTLLDINSAGTITVDATTSITTTTATKTINSDVVTIRGTEGSGDTAAVGITGSLDVDNIKLDGNTISTTDGSNTLYLDPAPSGSTGLVIIEGNLQVNGTQTTINSTTVTVDDPILVLGGDATPSSDDNLDRGVEFQWHNGTDPKLGFFGYDDSASEFIFVPDATDTSSVISGTLGNVAFGKARLTDTTASTTTSSGAFTVSGGVGISGQLNVGGATNKFTASTTSSSTTSGALVVTGGVGIGGSIWLGTNLTGAGAGTSTLDGFNIDGGTY